MQKPFGVLLILLMAGRISAQSISYNQYNVVLAEINPAYLAHIERDYVTAITRLHYADFCRNRNHFT